MLLLLLPAAAPIQILATNKLSSICGTVTSAVTYGRRVRPELRTALPLAVLALAGAVGGALSAKLVSKESFREVVLLALVDRGDGDLPAAGPRPRARAAVPRPPARPRGRGQWTGDRLYDGAIGPGTGTFLVFALVGLLGLDFLAASASAKIGNAATNLGALLVFVPAGAALWRLGLRWAPATSCGGFLGARTALARGSRFVRIVFLVVASALILRLGLQVARDH